MKNNINFNYFIRIYRTSKKAKLILLIKLDEIIIGSMLGDLTVPSIQSNTRL